MREHVEDAVAKGRHGAGWGKPHELGGNFWMPTVLGDCHEGMKLAEEEDLWSRSRLLPLHVGKTKWLCALTIRLTGWRPTFYTQNLSRVFRVSQAIESGMIGINECAVSTELGPFGGRKKSPGWAARGSVLGLEEFLEVKTLHIGGIIIDRAAFAAACSGGWQ